MEQIASSTGLPLSTAYRYVGTLRRLGFIERSGQRFDAGPKSIKLVTSVDPGLILGRKVSEVLTDIAVQTGTTAVLTVPLGWTARCVESAEPHNPIRLSHQRGVTLPLHVGASAKPLLAHLPGRTVEDYLRVMVGTGAGAHAGNERIRRQLVDIRRLGVCVTSSELDPQTTGIGIPLFLERTITACLSVTAHEARLAGRIGEVVDLLRARATTIVRLWMGPNP
jgi:DNA-binding IclR family transcriptional regulator